MIKKYLLISAIAFAIAIPVLVVAGNYHGGHGYAMKSWHMDDLDTDGNGFLSFDEFVAPNMDKWRSGFEMIDENGDGELDRAEWKALQEMHGVKIE
jgi:hypothetical protein